MLDRLASLATGHARRVVIVAALVFVVAGALGSGVADRLDPYGADDPSTESVIASDRLEAAGYRETGVVVLAQGVDPTSVAGRERMRALSREVEVRPGGPERRRLRIDRLARVRLARRRLDLPVGRPASRPTTTRSRTPPSGSPARSRASRA